MQWKISGKINKMKNGQKSVDKNNAWYNAVYFLAPQEQQMSVFCC